MYITRTVHLHYLHEWRRVTQSKCMVLAENECPPTLCADQPIATHYLLSRTEKGVNCVSHTQTEKKIQHEDPHQNFLASGSINRPWEFLVKHMDGPKSWTLQDTLVISNTRLGVTTSEAIGIPGNSSQNICAVKEGLREVSGGDERNRGSVVDSSRELKSGVVWSRQKSATTIRTGHTGLKVGNVMVTRETY